MRGMRIGATNPEALGGSQIEEKVSAAINVVEVK